MRTQRIRTAAGSVVDTALADTAEFPVYRRIAEEAMRLRELGTSNRAIARTLGVNDKTVQKAVMLVLHLPRTLREVTGGRDSAEWSKPCLDPPIDHALLEIDRIVARHGCVSRLLHLEHC